MKNAHARNSSLSMSEGRDGRDAAGKQKLPPSGQSLSSSTAIYRDLTANGYSYRTGDARAAEAAVAIRVLAKILLVIILGVVELGRGPDLGGDGAIAFFVQGLLESIL